MTEKFAAKAESGLHGCTPSVIACGDATFPKGTAFSGGDKVFQLSPKASPWGSWLRTQ